MKELIQIDFVTVLTSAVMDWCPRPSMNTEKILPVPKSCSNYYPLFDEFITIHLEFNKCQWNYKHRRNEGSPTAKNCSHKQQIKTIQLNEFAILFLRNYVSLKCTGKSFIIWHLKRTDVMLESKRFCFFFVFLDGSKGQISSDMLSSNWDNSVTSDLMFFGWDQDTGLVTSNYNFIYSISDIKWLGKIIWWDIFISLGLNHWCGKFF